MPANLVSVARITTLFVAIIIINIRCARTIPKSLIRRWARAFAHFLATPRAHILPNPYIYIYIYTTALNTKRHKPPHTPHIHKYVAVATTINTSHTTHTHRAYFLSPHRIYEIFVVIINAKREVVAMLCVLLVEPHFCAAPSTGNEFSLRLMCI